ncbi:hypothetical protein [Deinococcus humi]|uniref:Uncharacterized protein n=1 Tax=Deinococcus humi TaxID=662880 RepID=A0A7W8NDG9_9DEIO|nr:hypothetical protein [Deinococcus humi]MBB5363224.1 hypothetical protein [Deinococcus humi]GGO27583.1 hypothetical protein GCM10008949_19420 [Deinococcus humi]
MRNALILTALLLGTATTARAASLSEQLPAGALLTLETKNAGGAIDRFAGLLASAANSMTGGEEGGQMIAGFQQIVKGSLGQEAVAGVFSVGNAGSVFSPELLAVSRVDRLSGEFFSSLMEPTRGARVGNYTFSRQGETFAGMSNGLVYVSTNKDLLMGYLGRLSGKAAPRLMNSAAYTVPQRALGQQELSLFLNFSATAKVIRGALGKATMLPRLLSPVVDALDTLGQYVAGFTTRAGGLTATSAHAANAQGKDQPLYRILTDSTDFAVQDIIPADAENVVASACHRESGAYLGRWLTRVDLLDPLGFLTDSQLASHLERSAAWLGHECAQVTLAGGLKSGLTASDPLSGLKYSVTYQRVADMDAAKAQMPAYASSVNAAIAGVSDSLKGIIKDDALGSVGRSMPDGMGAAASSSLKMVDDLLGQLNMVYAFRGDYLITAFSQTALEAALDESAGALAQDAGFIAAGINPRSSAGWTYAPNPQDVSGEEISKLMLSGLGSGEMLDEMDRADDDAAQMPEAPAVADVPAAPSRSGKGRAVSTGTNSTDDMDADMMFEDEGLSDGEMMSGMIGGVSDLMADLINRYDGQTVQRTVQGNVITSKSSVLYRW